MDTCDICNQKNDFCSFIDSPICNCSNIHNDCWLYKLKDLDVCPSCNTEIYIHDCLEAYDEDGYLHCYSYYKNILINEFIFFNGSLIEEREFNNKIITRSKIYYQDQNKIYEELIKESETIEEIPGITIDRKFDKDGKLIEETVNDIKDKNFYSNKKFDSEGKLYEELFETLTGKTVIKYDINRKIISEEIEVF
jgi:hypothetical protein